MSKTLSVTVTEVQRLWKAIYNFGDECRTDGSQFDHLFTAGETFRIGSLEANSILHADLNAMNILFSRHEGALYPHVIDLDRREAQAKSQPAQPRQGRAPHAHQAPG